MPSTVVIANIWQPADGCQSTGKEFSVSIPNSDNLDLSYAGLVSGIEFQETTKVGDAGVRNVHFGNGVLNCELYANGGGTSENIPVIGWKCINPTGASIGYRIIAHYK